MKILFASLYDARFGMGGAEQVVLDLALGMKDRFHEEVACIVNPGDLAERLRAEKIPVSEVPYSKIKTPEMLARFYSVVRAWEPDIIHSHHRYMTFWADLLFKRKSCVLHSEQLLRQDKRLLFRCGHFTAACHESVRQNLIHYYHVSEDRTATVLNAVARPVPDPLKLEKIKKEYPAGPGQVTGLCIGRLEKQKGHTYLIEAVARLPKPQKEKVRIFLAGDGTLKPVLMRQAQERGAAENFIFLGYSKMLPEFLALCDFTLLPSLWEGSPLTLLLSYGAGKPALASDIEGIRDLMFPGQTGKLVRPQDPEQLAAALGEWIEAPEKIRACAGAVSRYWEKYSSLERTVAEYHDLYLRLLEEVKKNV